MTLIIGTPYQGAGTPFTLAAGDNFVLQPGILVYSTNGNAVTSSNGGHSFSVYGTIIGNQGIVMGDTDNDLGNKLIIGATGSVSSLDAGDSAIETNGGQSSVVNYGLITGRYGVEFTSDTGTGSAITNFGTITTERDCIYISGDENVNLVNRGTMISYDARSFYGDAGKNAVVNAGTMTGDVELWTNNDKYDGTGGRINGTVLGNDGNDTLIGGSFADKFDGGANGDFIYGRGGKDDLWGGSGPDNFYFDTAPNTASNRDIIHDYNAAEDSIYLKKSIFTALAQGAGVLQSQFYWESATGLAHDPTDRIILNTSNGVLTYDSNGNAPGGVQQQIAVLLMVGNTLSNLDFFVN